MGSEMIFLSILQNISDFFRVLVDSIPEPYKILISLLLYTLFIVIYAIFIWKFYGFMAEREILKLNLKQYTRSKRPSLEKFSEIVLNIVEYIIILPFLVLFWFTIFSIFLLLLSKSQSVYQILLISAAIIASTRITSYLSENLSRDLAKIFPFTVLAMFLLDPEFFNINIILDKIIQIPEIFKHLVMFILFIFSIEFMLRLLYTIAVYFYSKKEEPE